MSRLVVTRLVVAVSLRVAHVIFAPTKLRDLRAEPCSVVHRLSFALPLQESRAEIAIQADEEDIPQEQHLASGPPSHI